MDFPKWNKINFNLNASLINSFNIKFDDVAEYTYI